MEIIEKDTVQEAYAELIKKLLGKQIVGETREINNCCLIINKPSIEDYWLPYIKISEKYVNEELKWYWSANNNCNDIGQHASTWLRITDDGITSNSAYGYILFKKYGFNQVEQIIKLLQKDPTSRRAIINISDPKLNRIETKDLQCTIALQFLIRNDELEETVYMRSNDVNFGFKNDYVFFMTLGNYIASKLNIKLGKYTHHATSMHMYLRDDEKFRNAVYDNGQRLNFDINSIITKYYMEDFND